MADDLGYGDLGSYGQELIRTPRLDQMASEGMRFTNAYAGASICNPSRAVLMTGLHQGHVWPNWFPGGSNPDIPLEDSAITVAEVLRDSGYSTALIGKWGLGLEGSSGAPWNQGFGHFFGYLSQRRAHNYYPAYLVGNEGVRIPLNNEVIFRDVGRGQEIGLTRNDYSHDLFVDDALEWIEGNRDGPFFLYLSLTIPHANNDASKLIDHLPDEMAEHRQRLGMEVPDFGPYADEDWAAPLKGTAAMVTRMDTGVGQILDKLEELGIDRDTIVFFTSDNGPTNAGGNRPAFFDSSGPFRGLKKGLHEGGLRVPMIVRWPTRVPAGSVSDLVWHFADFLPTAAEFAGAELTHSIDGKSIAPDLLGQPSEGSDRFFYWRLDSAELAAVRWGKWKAIRNPSERPVQLYNLEEDPGERSDVACRHQGVVTNMREFMDTLDEHANLAPVFASSDRFNLTGNPSVIGTVVAEDDDDAVSGYWVAGGPHKDHFQISDSGVLTFAPDARFGPYADEADIGCLPFHTLGSNQYGVLVGAASGTGTRRRTSLQPIIVRIADGSEWPLTAGVLGTDPPRHTGQDEVSVRIGFSEAIGTSYSTMRDESLVVTNGTVQNAERVYRRSDLWEIDIAPSSEADIRVVLPPTTDCAAAGAVCTSAGKRLQSRVEVLIPGPSTPEISIAALASPVTEGTAAAFELTLDEAAPAALSVAVSVTESGSMLSGTPPASVLIPQAGTSATLRVPTAGDKVVEPDSTVTATVTPGAGYVAGTASRASVTVEDDDAAAFAVTAAAPTIREGQSATLTVAIANGATFAEDQIITLALSGTAAASDFSGVPPTLILPPGASIATATLVAEVDELEEEAETVTVTAAHDGSLIGSATVTIHSISHDATLEDLSLSGVDIGTFSGAVTSYEASVGHGVETVAVTATAGHPQATVTVEPGHEVSLSVGANRIDVTVTAEDGTTTRTYTVTVTRAAPPVATITADASPVSEGTAATFTVALDQPAPEALAIAVSVAETGTVLTGTPPASVAFAKGAASATLTVPTAADSVVEADSTITVTVTADPGYAVGAEASASVTVEDDDDAIFTVSADAEAIDEGESTTLTVAISNEVTFSEAQIITLTTTGTASSSDHSGVPPTLELAPGASVATATLAAATDDEEEDAETVTVTASHGGSEIGSATVTIHSISRDATLSGLSLSGIDIGTFSGAVTSYQASVAHSLTATTVMATASHSGATVTVEPGPEVGLAVGGNEIAITVTAEDGTTTNTYRVTVTRAALPVATIVAGATPVTEGAAATFTVSLDQVAPEALTVAVDVTESGSVLSVTPPASVAFAKGAASATLTVPTSGNSVVEPDSTVTASVRGGNGYTVDPAATASVTVENDDAATFTVSAEPATIREGESATLTVEIANGVTFAERQILALSTSGAASASDYSGVSAALTLAAGASSASLTLAAAADGEEEDAETLTVTASHGGSEVGSASVTIESVSGNATLTELSLSGVDIGTFSGAETSYRASVENSVLSTTVTAAASHSAATVTIEPGATVSLAEGANEIRVRVTAEDGTTTKTYTVTVTRLALPVVSIAALAERVAEGEQAQFRVTRTGSATQQLDVPVRVETSISSRVRTRTLRLEAGSSVSEPGYFAAQEDVIIWEDNTTTWTIQQGEGYAIAAGGGSATVVVEDNDVAEFALRADPDTVAEGSATTLTLEITNGVRYAEHQTIELVATGGTASLGADFTLSARSLTLRGSSRSATARLEALEDEQAEDNETVTLAALHDGAEIGSATVTIHSVSRDATLASLSLSGIDIGTFSSGVTAYRAKVPLAVETTEVTATASHSGATVTIEPSATVSLAEGANDIRVRVTAEDGSTTTYTVTVTREDGELPAVSIAALAGRVAEGEQAQFRVTRTGSTSRQLDVPVRAETSISPRVRTQILRLEAGSSVSEPGYFAAQEDAVIWEDNTATWTIQPGEGYVIAAGGGSATVVVEDNDVAEFALRADPESVAEGSATTLTLEITNGVRYAEHQTIELVATGGTASAGTDFTLSGGTLPLLGSSPSATARLEALKDEEAEDDETITLTARLGGETIAALDVTLRDWATVPLTAEFVGMPAKHDGQDPFGFELRFSHQIEISYRTLRDAAFEVTGGTVTGARRLERPSNQRWSIAVQPNSDADVVLTLPATLDCGADGAICTASGKALSGQVTATVEGPGSKAAGFTLAPENSSPSGIWSDGETAWVADLNDGLLYAYRHSDGERQPDRDIATDPAPMGLWSDRETLWVAGLEGGLRAHRLADGRRQAWRDLELEASETPAGVWSDGETVWVSAWLGDTVHAYRLADGKRVAGRDIKLTGENLMPVGVWSDGETVWVADWQERLYAYRLADGQRAPQRDIATNAGDTDPTGLWSGGGIVLSTSWEGREVRAYRMPVAEDGPAADGAPGRGAWDGTLPMIGDASLRAAIREALGKASGEAVSADELVELESLSARNSGVRDLAGLEFATGLKELDLGFNPLSDLGPLAALPALESLNLDGATLDLGQLMALQGLRRLSVRHNLIDDLQPLVVLGGLTELDIGDNRIEDLGPLQGLTGLEVLRADRNRIEDLWPLAVLTGLESLDLGANVVRDLQPLEGLERLVTLRLDGNRLSELHPLWRLQGLADLGLAGNTIEALEAIAGLDGLQRLDLRGNAVQDLRPLRGLSSLVWVHVGGSRIEDLSPLNGLDGLKVAGRDDLEPPDAGGGRVERSGRLEPNAPVQ